MNIMNMMKQAQELQGKVKAMQEELAALVIEGKSGAGLVVMTLSGKGEMLSLKVDPSLLKPDDAEMLEDLVIAAHSDARVKVEAASAERMQAATAGLPIPPGLKLF
jgi:nucleoid-associated protein EbfC